MRARLDAPPGTQHEVDRVLEHLEEVAAQRWDDMDEWELFDVDWSLFTPDAREWFPDPFFFDPAEEMAPAGGAANWKAKESNGTRPEKAQVQVRPASEN